MEECGVPVALLQLGLACTELCLVLAAGGEGGVPPSSILTQPSTFSASFGIKKNPKIIRNASSLGGAAGIDAGELKNPEVKPNFNQIPWVSIGCQLVYGKGGLPCVSLGAGAPHLTLSPPSPGSSRRMGWWRRCGGGGTMRSRAAGGSAWPTRRAGGSTMLRWGGRSASWREAAVRTPGWAARGWEEPPPNKGLCP